MSTAIDTVVSETFRVGTLLSLFPKSCPPIIVGVPGVSRYLVALPTATLRGSGAVLELKDLDACPAHVVLGVIFAMVPNL